MVRGENNADCLFISLPAWVPTAVVNYLKHYEAGTSIRALARDKDCHASTILRQIQKLDQRREEFLIDEALQNFASIFRVQTSRENIKMIENIDLENDLVDPETLTQEAKRVLRRLAEPNSLLAVAQEMEKAVIVREAPDGNTIKAGAVDRNIAQALALKDWISCKTKGKISRYRITQSGRSEMHRLLAAEESEKQGFSEAQAQFSDQHRIMGVKNIRFDGEERSRRVRYNIAESPVAILSRRKDKDGMPFLNEELVSAGERLREDFEMAQMGPSVTQNWDRFLTGGDAGPFTDNAPSSGPEGARKRVSNALTDLGPGLGDVALRCCCFLEGMETAEKKMGWSARSGKIVLRIALQRLKRHYDEQGYNALIG